MKAALIAVAALIVSPLGYLLIGPLGRLTNNARGVTVLSRIRIVDQLRSTNTALLADAMAVEGDWLVALRQEGGRGRHGRPWESIEGNFFGSTLVQLQAGRSAGAFAGAGRGPGADRGGRDGRSGYAACRSNGPTT